MARAKCLGLSKEGARAPGSPASACYLLPFSPKRFVLSTYHQGFTLIELVVVIVVLAIASLISISFVNYATAGYIAQARRAALVDDTTLVLSRMARDVRAALPNSVRVDPTSHAIEMLNVYRGGRYRSAPGPSHSGGNAFLQFNNADTDFNLLLPITSAATLPANDRLVIYNVGVPGANAYAGTDIVTPAATQITLSADGNETHIHLSPGFRFKYPSPAQRVYIIDGPVSYVCNLDAGTLTRYSGYPINPDQSTAIAASFGALATQDVSGCNFSYSPGTAQRAGVATLSLTLTRDGESVHLLEQVHVNNAP